MNSVPLGIELAKVRLVSLGAGLTGLVGALACFLGALVERGQPGGVSASLLGMTFGLVMPLTALSLSRRAFDSQALRRSLAEPARWGADRRRTLFGVVLVLAGTMALWFALLAGGVVWVGGGGAVDAARSAGVGAQAGLVYACCLAAASHFGAHGHGRVWWIGLDWVLGAGTSALALPFPRAHLANLLGAAPPAGISQGASTAAVLGLSLLALAYAQIRLPR